MAAILTPLSLLAAYLPVTASTAAPKAITGHTCTIIGTQKDDVLVGTFKSDVICGLGGNDRIFASSGNDIIDGGNGNDRISAGSGNDQIHGGLGADFIEVGSGKDICSFDRSDDIVGSCKTVKALTKLVVIPTPQPQVPPVSISPTASASISPTTSPTTSPKPSTSSPQPATTSSPVTGSPSSGTTSSPSSPGSAPTPTSSAPAAEAAVIGSHAGGSSPISNQSGTPSTTVTTWQSSPITLDFEAGASGLLGFGGDGAGIDAHPAGGSAGSTKAVKVVRGAESYAGTVFHLAGSDVNLISPTSKTVSLNFYSPTAGAPVLLKLEDAGDSSKYVEALATAGSVGWQTLSFNFDSPRSGTPSYNSAYQYRKAVIFYNFGSTIAGATYYVDQVSFPAQTATQTTTPGSPAQAYTQGSLLWEENFNGSGALDGSRWNGRYCGQSAANGGGSCYNNEQQ